MGFVCHPLRFRPSHETLEAAHLSVGKPRTVHDPHTGGFCRQATESKASHKSCDCSVYKLSFCWSIDRLLTMVAPRRASSRIVQRHVASIRQSKKQEQQEAMERKASMKMKRKPMEVYVQILTGRCITLSVSPDDDIQAVMEKIRAKEGINPDQQLLLFSGKKLRPDCTVDEYMIQANSKLFLTLRGLGG